LSGSNGRVTRAIHSVAGRVSECWRRRGHFHDRAAAGRETGHDTLRRSSTSSRPTQVAIFDARDAGLIAGRRTAQRVVSTLSDAPLVAPTRGQRRWGGSPILGSGLDACSLLVELRSRGLTRVCSAGAGGAARRMILKSSDVPANLPLVPVSQKASAAG